MKDFIEKHGLTASTLKWSAIIFMVINHLGYALYYNVGLDNYFLSSVHWYISRFAFVIFAFQIAEGMHYTHDRIKYILYLFVFAAISEVCYDLCFAMTPFDTSVACVLWALGLGASAIALIDHYKKKPLITVIITLLATIICFMMGGEYSITGIPMMVCFYYFRDTKWKAMTYSAIAFVVGACIEFLCGYAIDGYTLSEIFNNSYFWYLVYLEWHGLVAWILIFFYNGKKGKNLNKWFFYGFYPGHLFLLYLLTLLLIAVL